MSEKKFFVGACQPVGVFCDEQRRIIEILDRQGFCISSGGPLVSGKWIGYAIWFLFDPPFSAVVEQHQGYKGEFTITVASEDTLQHFAQIVGLIISEVQELGPRPSW